MLRINSRAAADPDLPTLAALWPFLLLVLRYVVKTAAVDLGILPRNASDGEALALTYTVWGHATAANRRRSG